MKATRTDRCVARLSPGQYKRVPRTTSAPAIGYYIACPSCSFVTPILAEEHEVSDGKIGDDDVIETMDRFACNRCGEAFRIDGGNYVRCV